MRGRPLPAALDVSRFIHTDVVDFQNFTLMLMAWGQFMDHDLAAFILSSSKLLSSLGLYFFSSFLSFLSCLIFMFPSFLLSVVLSKLFFLLTNFFFFFFPLPPLWPFLFFVALACLILFYDVLFLLLRTKWFHCLLCQRHGESSSQSVSYLCSLFSHQTRLKLVITLIITCILFIIVRTVS